ncbi:putative E3 ubiquitin-protein ligase RHG1A isoform X1 [Senna tora]|uniref:RING-type E3 ubiquitin transferase n=1 Tax=Senna tora TaxID=362788 RepID=A0A834SHY8_9FABA|nr:putative E3 ubiquitin-protein ligase RHG1A isoform X1 [Senna tora]
MGHRHLYSTSQMFENEHEQNWNPMHTDQHYVQLGRNSTLENGSFIYPVENMPIDGISFASNWNPTTRSNGFASSSLNIEVPSHQSDASGTSHDHFLHSSSSGAFFAVSENYAHQPSSSNYDRQAFHVVDGGFVDLTMGNGRGPHKRKSPGIPPVCERGNTSRYFNAGSSADLPISSELRQKPSMDSQYLPWDQVAMPPTFRGSGLSIRGEGSLRNVRSRSALDLESNLARSHLPSNPPHNYSTGPPIDHSSTVDLPGQSSSTLTRDWSQMSGSPAHGGVLLPDISALSRETSHCLVGSSASNASVDVGGYHHEYGTSGNPVVPQSFHNNLTHTARGVRSNFQQRSTPPFRTSSGLRLGHVAPSDDGLQMVAESYSSRHPRPLTTMGWRNSDRNGRSRVSSDRYRALADAAGLHDRFSSEVCFVSFKIVFLAILLVAVSNLLLFSLQGFMIVDRSLPYGSRPMVDQHRDMRMDIDNLSYEELLALGERIGHVSTGLSEDLISKCLTETIYCSSEQSQEEGTCVICLEEYKNMDDVGTLKTCRHDYHVSCIRKWLSMKNQCPICKAPALPDDTKDK